jgi:flagellin-like protein
LQKRSWIRKEEEGVSPVIATILMVAITVVLAAVLYVMVIGFGSGSSSTPAGAWSNVEPTNQTAIKLVYGKFTSNVEPMDIKIIMRQAQYSWEIDPAGGALTAASTPLGIGYTGPWPPPTATLPIPVYYDYNWQGNNINSGDYLTISNLQSGKTYSIELFHIPSESTISMTGDSGTVTTP